MSFPLATIHAPWGPINVKVLTNIDISSEDYEPEDFPDGGFFVYCRTAGTINVRPVGNDGTAGQGDIPITVTAGSFAKLDNMHQPCRAVRSHSTVTVWICYPTGTPLRQD